MVTKFNHEAAKYFKRYGEEYCGFYVHENPPGGQHHVHLGIHLPKKMAPKFKVWVRGFWGRSLCTTITPTLLHIRVRHRKTIGYRLIRQWALFSYLGKGVAPDTGYKDIHGEFEPLSSIFKLRRHKPQGIISCRKRIGVTQNIGAAAREKAGFRSAFEMGEENRLFDTTELDLFEKEQNDIFVEQSPQINIGPKI